MTSRPTHWQKGFATEAVAAIVDYAFEHGLVSKINRIQAMTHVDNLASERVLEKLGFQKEGLMRQYAYWDRRYHDMNLFSRLAQNSNVARQLQLDWLHSSQRVNFSLTESP